MFHHKFSSNNVSSGLLRTLIFTAGHYFIDTCCTHFIAGAEWRLAMASGMVSPLINAVWYFILDRVFFGYFVPKIRKKN